MGEPPHPLLPKLYRYTFPMPRAISCEAVVLATYNVGEADRFCILFTKEYGRLAARASAARKIGSRLGAALLPFHHLHVELREWNSGYVVTGARRIGTSNETGTIAQFLARAEIAELILLFLEEGEPLPELYESIAEVIDCTVITPLPHTVRILHLLGHMPSVDMPHFSTFANEEKMCIEQWMRGEYEIQRTLSAGATKTLSSLCEHIVHDHVGKRRNVPGITRLMAQ